MPVKVNELNWDPGNLDGVISHVFLPRKLPTKEQKDLRQIESSLIHVLQFSISSLNSSIFQSLFPKTEKLFQKWKTLQTELLLGDENNQVLNALEDMETGDMLAFYIDEQNAGLLITCQPKTLIQTQNRSIILSSFQALSQTGAVMSSTSDLVINFPEKSIEIPTTLLMTSEFMTQLAQLSRTQISSAMPQSKKAGHKFNEVRDVPDPMFITEWATAALSNKESKQVDDFPTITKKVRDDIVWQDSMLPFRRSGLWMTAKVALQISLIKEHGNEIGVLLYKLIMIKSMLNLLKSYDSLIKKDVADWDLIIQMMRKLARRMEKIKQMFSKLQKSFFKIPAAIVTGQEDIFSEITTTMRHIRQTMDVKWANITSNSIENYQIDVSEMELISDTKHQMTQVEDFIEMRKISDAIQNQDASAISIPNCPKRIVSSPLVNVTQYLTGSGYELDFQLWELEVWILNNLDSYCNKLCSALKIKRLIFDYAKVAVDHYKEDPAGNSRLVLCVLKALQILDQIAITAYPMLRSHKTGVDLTSINSLLLPTKSDMDMVFKLEKYFSARDAAAAFPSLIQEFSPSQNSFAVRYAKENVEMEQLRSSILVKAEKEIQAKKEEVLLAVKDCAELEERIRYQSHEYKYNNYYEENQHVSNCTKCSLERQLKQRKVSVSPYERPLPNDETRQRAIVFEFLLPNEIAFLRDTLLFFNVDLCQRHCVVQDQISIHKDWCAYNHSAITYSHQSHAGLMMLGSTTKPCLSSHYKEMSVIFNSPENFILKNGMNEVYHRSCAIKLTTTLQQRCTFQIAKNTLYSGLQWTLNGTAHTLNQVLARQNECHVDLSLPEFIQFGCLRAGHRVQYRNIITSLVNGKLSLKAESVFALICQAQWQAGDKSDTAFRESHLDFSEQPFAEEALKILNTLVDQNSKTWSDPYTMINLVIITARILELTTDEKIKKQAVDLLRKCRKISTNWIQNIKKLVGEAFNAPEEHKLSLKLNLIYAALVSTFTFYVSSIHTSLVMKHSEDLYMWLQTVSTLYDEVHWNTKQIFCSLSNINWILIRMSVAIGVSLENQIQHLVRMDNDTALNKFTKDRWKVSDSFKTPWKACTSPNQQVYECTNVSSTADIEDHVIHIDVLLGKFLLDGCPVSRLPEAIIKHPLYQRVFQKAEFQVQPNKQKLFTASLQFHGCTYTFKLDNGQLIIRETNKETRQTSELLPHKLFTDIMPNNLTQNYSHWWNPLNATIQFRPKTFETANFVQEIVYELSLVTRKLIEKSTQRQLIFNQSCTFLKLTNVLKRIEPPEFIHAWLTKNNKMEIELARLRLKFYLKNYNLESHEFPGMHLRKNQNIGCLVGLETKIILEAEPISFHCPPNQKVIVPYSEINVVGTQLHHQITRAHLEMLRSPGFFVYDVDHKFKTLKAIRNQSAWLYLALLHAKTSSPLPDEFTGVTGTEMAFDILQSARCWSAQPYDRESKTILNWIADLSPKRTYYPEHFQCMQRISWPSGIPSSAAHEGFHLIVKKLFKDSMKLASLFKLSEQPNEEQMKTENILILRQYWRRLPLENQLATIQYKFDASILATVTPAQPFKRFSLRADVFNDIRTIADISYNWNSCLNVSMIHIVKDLLYTSADLAGKSHDPLYYFELSTITTWLDYELRNNWIDLYVIALEVKNRNWISKWKLLLSTLAFTGVDMRQLYILQAVAVNPEYFVAPPTYGEYKAPSCSNRNFSRSNVMQVFNSHTKPFSQFDRNFSTNRDKNNAIDDHQSIINNELKDQTDDVVAQWPTASANLRKCEYASRINTREANIAMNSELKIWFHNLKLKEFLLHFESCIAKVIELGSEIEVPRIESIVENAPILKEMSCFQINYNNHLTRESETLLDKEYSTIYETGTISHKRVSKSYSNDEKLLQIIQKGYEIQTLLEEAMASRSSHVLIASGLYPRITPQFLMQLLLQSNKNFITPLDNCIGALAVIWTLEQRLLRCITYEKAGPTMEVALQREMETIGYEGWSPKDHPGWLILQLEMNMMIRPIQLKVANAMMHPESGKNSVMQLNMGEGKTSLIVPMLAISLADKKQLCRVTVLKSIFETNFNHLRFTVGGLLDRRVCTIPCKRDLIMGPNEISTIQQTYTEFMLNQGIVVSLPEYRLSFQLKGFELARKGEINLAQSFIDVQNWLNANTRDVLDESDEILSVKYQLVYTVGSQLPVGGGEMRWIVVQNLLKRLPKQMKKSWEQFGDSCIEYTSSNNSAEFEPCRLLKKECYQSIIDGLADAFLDGEVISFPNLMNKERTIVKEFLTNNKLNKADVQNVYQTFAKDPKNLEIMLILAGLLRFEVLQVALTKRWRVNYGVNSKGHRKMAIPFKAKDVASERTEFGHPDMAILLTQLSYYYSGLNDQQLKQCFDILKNKHRSPSQEYGAWIAAIPSKLVHDSVKNYSGVNLADYNQRTKILFPLLRKTMAVIDFWLTQIVFPKESKQFEGKMTCTAWDLCSSNQKLLTTGFSGTNDSSKLLPLEISQNDLPELKKTNAELENTLLRPENNTVKKLPTRVTCLEMLKLLKKENIKVLLDSGALMLELNNQQVAEAWLKEDNSIDAVVYFNAGNVLTVKSRSGQDTQLELSPYRESLNRCAIYLDDEHTRGTDLKFPRGSVACVTIGSGLTRDKLAQTCMRMRLLGKGHSVTFWTSHEAYHKIKDISGGKPNLGSQDVLSWVCNNSITFESDGLVYWTAAGVNYFRKLAAEIAFNEHGENFEKFQTLGNQCTEDEVIALKDMYGHAREEKLFIAIIPTWFEAGMRSLIRKGGGVPLTPRALIIYNKVLKGVTKRCTEIIPNKRHFSQLLEEEQEKELENELEEEEEIQKPGPATPKEPSMHPDVIKTVTEGVIQNGSSSAAISKLPCAFKNTTIWKNVQENCWGDQIYVTEDYIQTVKQTLHDQMNEYLAPPTWIVSMPPVTGHKECLLVISQFEANAFLPLFRKLKLKSILHMYTPRLLPNQKLLLNNGNLTLPARARPNRNVLEDVLAPLSIFSGNLYYNSVEEQAALSNFLAIIPRPMDDNQNEAFTLGYICQNGFVLPENRIRVKPKIPNERFNTYPADLVMEILRTRHQGYVPPSSNVSILVRDGRKVIPNETDTAETDNGLHRVGKGKKY